MASTTILKDAIKSVLLSENKSSGSNSDGSDTTHVYDVDWDKVVLLLRATGDDGDSSIKDYSKLGKTVTISDTTITTDTADSLYYGKSFKATDSDNALIVSDAGIDDFDFTDSDWTVEFFVKPDMEHIFNLFDLDTLLSRWAPQTLPDVVVTGSLNGSNINASSSTWKYAENTGWHHIALSYVADETTLYLHIDGYRISYSTSIDYSFSSADLNVLKAYSSSYLVSGNMEEFRITKGVAIYTDSVEDIPTSPFPCSAGGSRTDDPLWNRTILMLRGQLSNGTSTVIDVSNSEGTVVNDSVTVSTDSPMYLQSLVFNDEGTSNLAISGLDDFELPPINKHTPYTTIEFDYKPTASAIENGITFMYKLDDSGYGWSITYSEGSFHINYISSDGTKYCRTTGYTSMNEDEWNHLCFSNTDSSAHNWIVTLNGTSKGTSIYDYETIDSYTDTSGYPLYIGSSDASMPLYGELEELRVTKAYRDPTVVPTEQFPS